MKILITGSSGLLGQNLKKYISHNNSYFITSKDVDLREKSQVQNLFNNYKPTHVINLAAYVGGLYKNEKQNVEFFNNNMLINLNIMDCCYKYGVTKLVSILSTCIFPNNITYPIEENMLHNGPPHNSNIGYSYAKRMVDIMTKLYNLEKNTNFISIIPGNLYGPHDNFNIEDGHVIPALIHKCFIAKQNNTNFEICGSGLALRQFTYADDLAKAIIWAIDNYNSSEPIIVSNLNEISIHNLVDIISKELNFKGKIIYDITKNDGQYKKTISNNLFISKNPNFKFTNLNTGIKNTIEWFIENYNYCRK